MKMYYYGVALIAAMLCTMCLPASTVGQGFSRTMVQASGRVSGIAVGNGGQGGINSDSQNPGNGAASRALSSTSASASRSVSFTKNGKRISISENESGITVSVNGQSVGARNAEELKKFFPDAYQLYAANIGAAQASGFARGSAGGSAGSTSSAHPGHHETKSSSSRNRSISLIDNGKKVSITESAAGITVTVDGKTIRARNAEELKERSPEAYKLYETHLAEPKARPEGSDAKDLLRAELKRMQEENAGNPAVRGLFEQMLREVDK